MSHDANQLVHPREEERIEALRALNILDTPIEERFERITRLVSKALDMPICMISCVDEHRQWFKSIVGLNLTQTDRCVSFCQHTVLNNEIIVIPDARFDSRFVDNPLVTGEPGIVFYAGAPIFSRANLPVAALCVIDRQPRCITEDQKETLREFAKLVECELAAERANPIEDALIGNLSETWRASMIDPLTRVWNHEGVSTLITETIRYQREKHTSVGVAIIDLVGHQSIVEQQGDARGDEYLRRYCRAALREFNHGETLGRLNGSEFALLTPRMGSKAQLKQRLNQLVDIGENCGPSDHVARPNAYGLWIPNDFEVNPEVVLEQLCDGLFELGQQQDEHVRVQTIPELQNDQAAA